MPFPDIDKYAPLPDDRINAIARIWQAGDIISDRDIPEENDKERTMTMCFPVVGEHDIHAVIAETFDGSGEEFGMIYGYRSDNAGGLMIDSFPMITAFGFLSERDLDRVIDVATRLDEALNAAYREVAPLEGEAI